MNYQKLNYLQRIVWKLYNCSIRFGYISLCEIPDNLKELKKNYGDNLFWIIEGYYGLRNKIGTKGRQEFQNYIEKLIE